METRSVIWTLTIVCCLISESTELVLPSARWTAAGAALTAVTADSVTGRQQRSPPPGPTAAVTASSSPRERTKRASGGHQASSETAAAGHSAGAGRQRGPTGRDVRVRPQVMLVNRDGEPHSLAPVRTLAVGSRPGLLTEEVGSADGARRRGRRSLLSPPAVGVGQVLVGLARGPDASLIPPTPQLTVSAFLVQFSEIGGRTKQVVGTRGGTGDGAGSEGEGRVIQGQAQNQEQTRQRQRQEPDQRLLHGQRQDQGNTEYHKSHGQGQEVTGPLVSSEQGRHRYQTGAENTAQGTTALQSQRPTEVSDTGADLQPGLADSDRLDGHRPPAGQSPVRSHHDQRQTEEAASSVTVTESLQPRLRPAEPDQHPVYENEAPDQDQGYNYETPEQAQGYNYEAPDQQQGYSHEMPCQQQGCSHEMPNQLEVTITDLQTTQNSNVRLTGANIFTTPRSHDIGGDISATPAFHSNVVADAGPLAGPEVSQPARTSPGCRRNNPSPSVSNELAADGNIRPGRDRDQSLCGRVSNELTLRRQAASSGRRPRPEPTEVSGHPATAESQPDSIRRPDAPSQFQPAGVRAVSDGRTSNPTLSAQKPANLNTVIPDLPSITPSGFGQAASGTNNGRPAADTGYQYDPPAATDAVYQYDPPSSSDAGYQYDPPVTDTGYQYNPAAGTDNGYQYDPPSASDTGCQYNPAAGTDTGYQYDPPSASDTGYQYNPAAGTDTGYQYNPAAGTDTGYQYDPPATGDNGYQYNNPSSASNTGYQYNPPSVSETGYRYDPPATGESSINAITAPEFHVDHWHRPRPLSSLSPTNTSPSHPTVWRPMIKPSAATPSTVRPGLSALNLSPSTARPELSSGDLSPSTPRPPLAPAGLGPSSVRPDLHAAGEGSSTARPQLTVADLSPSTGGPEFPAPRLDAAPLPRGLMWPVMDVLERTMAARMVFAATVGEPDGVLVRHRGTAQPLQHQPRRRRRRAVRPGQDRTDMQHALAMVAALTGRTGTEPADQEDDAPSIAAPQTDVPLSQLPLQPAPVVWPRSGEEGQQTSAAAVSADPGSDGSAPVNTTGRQLPLQPAPAIWPRSAEEGQQTAAAAVSADLASDAVSTADLRSDAVSTTGPGSAPVSTAGRQQAVLPAPRAATYPNLRPERQLGVAMELDQTSDGAALWGADLAPADHLSSVLDQFPFEPSITRDEHSKLGFDGSTLGFELGFDGIDSAFDGAFFDSFPDKPFPLEDVVIPDFYFVDEFDTKENSIASGGSIKGRSSEPNSLVVS